MYPLEGDVDNGGDYACEGQGVFAKYLYFVFSILVCT